MGRRADCGVTQRFQLSTRRTGTYRVVKVVVYETQEQLTEQLTKLYPLDDTAVEALGCCHLVRNADNEVADHDPRPHFVTLYFSRGTLDGTVIAHEAVHAAMALYQIDCYRQNARAMAHMKPENEIIAYLVGDIFSAVVQKLDLKGEPLPTGWGRRYAQR